MSARSLEEDPKQPGSLADTVRAIEASGGEVLAVQADLSKPEDRVRLVSETEQRFGPVDILVNNAAVTVLIRLTTSPRSGSNWRNSSSPACAGAEADGS